MAQKHEDIVTARRIQQEQEIEKIAELHDQMMEQYDQEVEDYFKLLKSKFKGHFDDPNNRFEQFKKETEKYLK